MIMIDRDALCEDCGKDPSRCEGAYCEEARASYIEDHGLVDTEGESFSDLAPGDEIFWIFEEKIKILTVTGISVNTERFLVITGRKDFKVHPAAMMDKDKGVFMRRADVVAEYQSQITAKVARMVRHLVIFQTPKPKPKPKKEA